MTCAQGEVQTKAEKENSEGGLAGDGENVLKKDYLQGALKSLLSEVTRLIGHGIHHTFDIALRVKNANDIVGIKIKCLLTDSNLIHYI